MGDMDHFGHGKNGDYRGKARHLTTTTWIEHRLIMFNQEQSES